MKEIYFNEEVFGRPPARILYWGNTVLLLIIVSILALAALIPYPDRLGGEVVLSTEQAPIDINPSQVGEIDQVLVQNGGKASAQQVVVTLKSLAKYVDVLKAEQTLLKGENLAQGMNLGELNGAYQELIFKQNTYQHHQNTDISAQKGNAVENEVANLRQLAISMKRQIAIQTDEFNNIEYDFLRSQELLREGIMSKMEVEKSENHWLAAKRQLQSANDALLQNNIRIEHLKTSKIEIQKTHLDQAQNQGDGLFQAKKNLSAAIESWKKQFLVRATVSGIISYFKPIHVGDITRPDQPLLSILPQFDEQESIAIAQMPLQGLGKVKKGQEVRISIYNYPAEEFGNLVGTVKDIALNPKDKKQAITISLPKEWITDMKKEIPKSQNLSGDCVIYTKNQTLLQRLFGKIWKKR
jgi:multidrug resistance efflux pump